MRARALFVGAVLVGLFAWALAIRQDSGPREPGSDASETRESGSPASSSRGAATLEVIPRVRVTICICDRSGVALPRVRLTVLALADDSDAVRSTGAEPAESGPARTNEAVIAEGHSHADGRWTVDLPHGRYEVRTARPGYLPTSATIRVPDKDNSIALTLLESCAGP